MPMRPVLLALLVLGCGAACAQEWMPHSAFVAGAMAPGRRTDVITAGVAWPWSWRRLSLSGEWSASTELFVSRWRAREAGSGDESLWQVGVVPVFRYRFGEGRSPWFAEGGIGVSWTDRLYVTPRKTFSTRFNFYDTLGVGRSFGAHREHEVALRLAHVSNGGIREPNPGENFIQLRYARNF